LDDLLFSFGIVIVNMFEQRFIFFEDVFTAVFTKVTIGGAE
jgi:hypothetical protein